MHQPKPVDYHLVAHGFFVEKKNNLFNAKDAIQRHRFYTVLAPAFAGINSSWHLEKWRRILSSLRGVFFTTKQFRKISWIAAVAKTAPSQRRKNTVAWMPAFAGMTTYFKSIMQKQSFDISVSPDQKFIYQHILSVRISDMNYGNHLAATAVPPMLQQTRIKFLRTHHCSEVNIGGVGLILVDLYVHYLCESFFDDELFIQLGVESIGKNNAVLVYQIENLMQKRPMAIAKEKIVFFDYNTRKVAKTPKIFCSIAQTTVQ